MKYKINISFRIDDGLSADLDKAIRYRGESRSSLIRRALFRELARYGLLSKEREKALCIGGVTDGRI